MEIAGNSLLAILVLVGIALIVLGVTGKGPTIGPVDFSRITIEEKRKRGFYWGGGIILLAICVAVWLIVYLPQNRTLSISHVGDGYVSLGDGKHEYLDLSVVMVEAKPLNEMEFIGWQGDVIDKNSAVTSIKMDADKSITAQFAIAPSGEPDLMISQIEVSPSKPKIGDLIIITVAVKNQGSGTAGISQLEIRADGQEDEGILFTVPLLPPSNQHAEQRQMVLETEDCRFRGIADSLHQIDEKDENNNWKVLPFTIPTNN